MSHWEYYEECNVNLRKVFHYTWWALQMSFCDNLFSQIQLAAWFYGTLCAKNEMTASHQWCEAVIWFPAQIRLQISEYGHSIQEFTTSQVLIWRAHQM